MASWTEIPNSSLESGAPIRAVDGVAFRDNPVAIAEGATGAPRILYQAIDYGATIPKPLLGSSYQVISGSFAPPDNTPLTLYVSTNIFGDGSLSVYLNTPYDPSGSLSVYVYVNGVLAYSKSFTTSTNSGYVTLSWATTLANIEIKAVGNSSSNNTVNWKLTSGNPAVNNRLFSTN